MRALFSRLLYGRAIFGNREARRRLAYITDRESALVKDRAGAVLLWRGSAQESVGATLALSVAMDRSGGFTRDLSGDFITHRSV